MVAATSALLILLILIFGTPIWAGAPVYVGDCSVANGNCQALDDFDAANANELLDEVTDNDARIDALLTTDTCTTPPCDLTSGTTLGTAAIQTGTDDDVPDSADGDFADATDLEGTGAISANAVALGTDTTGNYVATIADSGASEVTVANSGSETAAVTLAIAAGLARDAESTTHCVGGGMDSPDNTDRVAPGLPFAITITNLSCTVGGTTPSITLGVDECNSSGASCVNGGISLTCDGGIDSDASFTDAAFDANDAWNFDTGTASGTVDYISWQLCYTRQVVE